MLNVLKDIAAKQVGRVLASDATLKVLTNPQFKSAMVKAINLRAEARDAVEKSVKEVASALELVTREDVAGLRRTIRDLQDTVAELRAELQEAHTHAETPAAAEAAAPARKPAARKSKAAS